MANSTSKILLGRLSCQPAFDGLRAICITTAIAFHVGSWDRAWLNNQTNRGWVGVDVFFVLSGFLITWIVVAELERSGTSSLRRSYFRCVLRQQPAFFSGLIAFSLATAFLPSSAFLLDRRQPAVFSDLHSELRGRVRMVQATTLRGYLVTLYRRVVLPMLAADAQEDRQAAMPQNRAGDRAYQSMPSFRKAERGTFYGAFAALDRSCLLRSRHSYRHDLDRLCSWIGAF